MRRYWHPVALSSELELAPIPVRILGENLVLFRTADDTPALVAARCPHRGTDLTYARLERGALRCLYHGWLIAGNGRCLEMPGEPAGSTFPDKVRHTAYPCRELHGIVFAYMGPGDPTPFPQFPWVDAPAESVWAAKMLINCNYLQANEGNCDPQHLSVLHRFFEKAEDDRSFDRSRDLWVADPAPEIEVEDTPFGLRIYAIRDVGSDQRYVRITNFIMPNNSSFGGSAVVDPKNEKLPENSYYHFHWHVPIDDGNHWKYRVSYRVDGAIDKAYCDSLIADDMDENFNRPRRLENRYLQSRENMAITFTGMGHNFQDHDRFAVESQGEIADRSIEHLGTPDRAVIAMRRVMLRAVDDVEGGREPLMAHRDGNDALAELVTLGETIPASTDLRALWREHVLQ
jgi:phenylpropionate dioxygenase-like ring-hydroxylating dioxygenase large terminal subunit